MTDESDTLVRLPVLGRLTYRECHALVNGVYIGARWGTAGHSYTTERHYWRAGYLAGTAARYCLLAIVVSRIGRND